MFDYLENPRTFAMALGNYVSHKVIKTYEPSVGHRLRTVEEINSLDRIELAKDFFYERFEKYANDSEEHKRILALKPTMINDIAVYIDSRIPKSYYKWSNRRHDIAPSKVRGVKAEDMGLIYWFSENETDLLVTDKQKNYILFLIEDTGYKVKTFDDMSIKDATDIISFLIGDIGYTPECFFKYIQYED